MLRDQGTHHLRGFPRQLALDHDAALALIRNLLNDLFPFQIDYGRKYIRKRFGIGYLAGICRERIGGGAHRQHLAVSIVDFAARGMDRAFARPLRLRPQLQFLRAEYLKLEQARAQRKKQRKENRHQQRDAAADHRPRKYQRQPSPAKE